MIRTSLFVAIAVVLVAPAALADAGANVVTEMKSGARRRASATANGVFYGNSTVGAASTAALTDGQIVVGQTSSAPLPKALSGDATLAASGALTVTGSAGAFTSTGLLTGSAGLTVTGGAVNLNASSNNAVNVGTGTTTSTVTIGGAGTQSIAVGDGAGAKTVTLGSATGASSTAINSGTGDLTITSTDDLTINGGSAGSILTLGGNTDGNTLNVCADDTTADTITVGSAKDTSVLRGIAVTVGSTGTTSALTLQSGTGDVTITSTDDINIGANAAEQDLDIGNATGASSLDLFAGTGNISVTGSFDSDFVWATGIAGGADLSVAAGAADTAGSSFDLTGAAGGAASADQVGKNGGVLSVTGGAGSAKNGAGATDGDGGDLVLLGGARGGATGGTEVHGIVRVGSPTVGSTKATNVLAVGGAFETDGAARFDGAVTLGDAATDTITVTGIFASDFVWDNGISGGVDLTIEQAASATAGDTLDLVAGQGGAAAVDANGQNGGALTLTGGTGTDQNGTGLTGGTGGALTFAGGGGGSGHATGGTSGAGGAIGLTGGAGDGTTVETGGAGGALNFTGGAGGNGTTTGGIGGIVTLLGGAAGTGGAPNAGYVRVGSPTVGSTIATNLLAVGGAFEVDGVTRFDGTVAFNSTTTLQAGDIIAADILDLTRSVPLPLGAWVPCAGTVAGIWDASGADTEPDLAAVNTALVVEYDATGGSIDADEICTSFTVPQDYASGGSFAFRFTQAGATGANVEDWDCRLSVDGAGIGAASSAALVNQTAVQTITLTPAGTWAAAASIGVACKQSDAAADDAIYMHSAEGRYTATQ